VRAALVAVVTLVALVSSAGAGGLGGSSGPSFGRARAYAAGHAAAVVAVGDLTGDAKPDLVTVNGPGTVAVLINRGNGSFSAKRDFATGAGPRSVAIGDLNADGSGDVATANFDGNSVSVLLNDGDGSFGAKRDYPTGHGAGRVVIGDVNADGKLDLVTSNTGGAGATGISVLLNTGDGTFQAKRDFGPGLLPIDLAIGDLNGDSKPDLATVNEYAVNGVTVFLNAGDGTFPAKRQYLTVIEASSIEIGDVSGDGKADLVWTYSEKESGPGVVVYLNRGRGEFRSGGGYSVHGDWATGGSSVAIGDLNGDRKADLAVTSRLHAVSVLVNLGAGRFRRQLDYGTGYPGALAIDDLNGDRRRDLVVATSPTVSVLLNKPGLCNVQKLNRLTLKAAKQTLARVNCRVGKVSFDYSRTIKGLVIRQKPKLGAVLPRGSRVDVVISRGRTLS
jgi:FG-GAP-like repeat/PASTA domain